jgi:hypothetical protein
MVGDEKSKGDLGDDVLARQRAIQEAQAHQTTEQEAAEKVRESAVRLMSAAQRAAERAQKRKETQEKAIERAVERAQKHEALDESQEENENSTNFPPNLTLPDENEA